MIGRLGQSVSTVYQEQHRLDHRCGTRLTQIHPIKHLLEVFRAAGRRTPIWMMRQAAVICRNTRIGAPRLGLLDLCFTPVYAARSRCSRSAASTSMLPIIFSDIL